MILFKEDWNKYPGAIPDFKTKQTSWIRMAALYKKMGIENYLFMLALHNPELSGVDPFSSNLTEKQILMISVEAKNNPWYVLRELIRLPATASPEPIHIRANRANIALWWLFFNHVTTMLIQPRQTGKSVSTDALMVTLFAIMTTNTDINLLTKDDNLRNKNIARLKAIIDGLPWYFKLKDRKDTYNTEKLTLARLGNTYHTSVGQASEKAALNLGRGMTIAINHIDEIAFVRNIDVTLPALLAAASSARDLAKEQGAPYGNIFTTTPGYLNNPSGRYAYKIYNESFRWTEKLLDSKNMEELHKIIKDNTKGSKLQVVVDMNHRQLGFTDEWLREKINDAMSEGEDAGADFLNIWAAGSTSNPITKEHLKIIQDSRYSDPYINISKYGYITRWFCTEHEYNTKMKNARIVIGIDTSDAVGNDGIGMVGRLDETGETIFSGNFNETNVIKFSEWLVEILSEFKNTIMIIERRSTGVMVIDNLLYILPTLGINPFTRLFNWIVHEMNSNPKYLEIFNNSKRNNHVDYYTPYRKHFGYATGGSGKASRDNLYGTGLIASVKYTGNTVRDPELINQLSGLTIKNDRIDHKSGNHDDLVIAWLLCFWLLSEGRNINAYGLDKHTTLSVVTEAIIEEEGGQEMVEYKKRQLELKSEIDKLINEVKNTVGEVKKFILTNKIKMLYRKIDTNIIQTMNIDALLDNLKMSSKSRRL